MYHLAYYLVIAAGALLILVGSYHLVKGRNERSLKRTAAGGAVALAGFATVWAAAFSQA